MLGGERVGGGGWRGEGGGGSGARCGVARQHAGFAAIPTLHRYRTVQNSTVRYHAVPRGAMCVPYRRAHHGDAAPTDSDSDSDTVLYIHIQHIHTQRDCTVHSMAPTPGSSVLHPDASISACRAWDGNGNGTDPTGRRCILHRESLFPIRESRVHRTGLGTGLTGLGRTGLH